MKLIFRVFLRLELNVFIWQIQEQISSCSLYLVEKHTLSEAI